MERDAVAYLSGPDDLAPQNVPPGLRVVHTVRDADPERAGLTEALSWIEDGRADALLLVRLGAAARSLGELIRLLDWIRGQQAALVAADLGLDTGQPAGRLALDLLHEVQRWAREPESPRRPPGRPGLQSVSPELAQRIVHLRERGLSLHAIADALNAQGIPTPRGGARWRPSSVQTALGYRRPRPPAPPLPRPGGARPGRPGPRGGQGQGPRPKGKR